jgi:hypothetical protein
MEAIVTPVDGADNAPKRAKRPTLGPPIQPARELAPNKSKQMQVKPREKAWISGHTHRVANKLSVLHENARSRERKSVISLILANTISKNVIYSHYYP